MSTVITNSRVWLVTGSSQGLGRALVEAVLEAGERAVATLRKPEQLADLAQKYPSSQLLVLPLDVTNEAQIAEAFEATRKTFGRLDVVVNNAGYGLSGEFEAIPKESARKQIEVLFWGPVNITREAIKFMREVNPQGQGGRILNLSSIGGYIGNPSLSFYSAGKFALEGFTEAVTKEMLPEWNIKVSIIQPGGFKTEWGKSSMEHIPPHPLYAQPTSPTTLFNKMRESSSPIGDPAKAAKTLMAVASLPNPPMRVQFGTESLIMIRKKAQKTLDDTYKYEDLSHSTNFDGVQRDRVMDLLTEVKIQ